MGEKIRELRTAMRISQRELAELSGVSRQTIASIEQDPNASVRTGTLEAIAKALGVSVRVFFE